MAGSMKWHGDQAKRLIAADLGRKLDACRFAVEGHAKVLINVDGTGTRGTGKKKTLVYGANPSKPGEPPHKQTGQLQGSVASERVGMVARVGSNLKKALWLELGTATMAARPWLRRALLEMTGACRAILGRPMKP